MSGERPEWFEEWLTSDHHVPDDSGPVRVGEAERRLRRRARILDWTQVGLLVLLPLAIVSVVVALFVVVGAERKVNHRADEVARAVADQAAALRAQSASQDQLRRIAEALGRLETATTNEQKQDALAALEAASREPPPATQAVPPSTTTTRPAPPTTAGPPAPAPPPTPTTTTTAPARPPPTTPPTPPCLLPLSALCNNAAP